MPAVPDVRRAAYAPPRYIEGCMTRGDAVGTMLTDHESQVTNELPSCARNDKGHTTFSSEKWVTSRPPEVHLIW